MDNLAHNIERFPQGHPVRVYLEENVLIRKLFEELFKTDINTDFQLFFNLFNQFCRLYGPRQPFRCNAGHHAGIWFHQNRHGLHSDLFLRQLRFDAGPRRYPG